MNEKYAREQRLDIPELNMKLSILMRDLPCSKYRCDFWDTQGHYCYRGRDDTDIDCPFANEVLALFPERLDRPELEKKIRDILYDCFYNRDHKTMLIGQEYKEAEAQLLVLFPSEGEIKEQERRAEALRIAQLTILVREIQDCKNMVAVRRLLKSWIDANDLEPEKVETYNSTEELLQALQQGGD